MLRCGRAALSGCVLSVGLSGAARAQPADVVQESARALADEGANAYAAHDDERALALFQRAYMLVPAPTIALFEARTLAAFDSRRATRGCECAISKCGRNRTRRARGARCAHSALAHRRRG
jgi:hypothetical protein